MTKPLALDGLGPVLPFEIHDYVEQRTVLAVLDAAGRLWDVERGDEVHPDAMKGARLALRACEAFKRVFWGVESAAGPMRIGEGRAERLLCVTDTEGRHAHVPTPERNTPGAQAAGPGPVAAPAHQERPLTERGELGAPESEAAGSGRAAPAASTPTERARSALHGALGGAYGGFGLIAAEAASSRAFGPVVRAIQDAERDEWARIMGLLEGIASEFDENEMPSRESRAIRVAVERLGQLGKTSISPSSKCPHGHAPAECTHCTFFKTGSVDPEAPR